MVEPTIEHPKVFISYAWSSEPYQEKVLQLGRELISVGVDVLLDKWSLKEGHDKNYYMEQCVRDETVTNVIILLDPVYAQKADNRSGGVGAETQIISPEIYNEVSQKKFIPIVFERDAEGNIPEPIYLRNILYFDLSDENTYPDEFKRLVKRLYGVENYTKPELGNQPQWLTEEIPVPSQNQRRLNSLKKNNNLVDVRVQYVNIINNLRESIEHFQGTADSYLLRYNETIPFRQDYISALYDSSLVNDANILIGDFLQDLYYEIYAAGSMRQSTDQKIIKTFLHELFIYTIVYFYKVRDYASLKYFLNRQYMGTTYVPGRQDTGFHIFYFYNDELSRSKCRADNKEYLSGTAQHWMDNIAADFCTMREFAFADVLLCNYSIYGANYHCDRTWFPITYIYDGGETAVFRRIASQLKSREIADRWTGVFGYSDINAFKKKISDVNDGFTKGFRNGYPDIRYGKAFESATVINDFIKPNEFASLR